ncbi:hypothetical protein YC2023_028490 [Brassica napus]
MDMSLRFGSVQYLCPILLIFVFLNGSFEDNNNVLATESRNSSGGLRWRSDEASDEEDELKWDMEPTSFGSMPVKGRRSRRFAYSIFFNKPPNNKSPHSKSKGRQSMF